MASSGGSNSAWRWEEFQELALAEDLQSGLDLSAISTDVKLVDVWCEARVL